MPETVVAPASASSPTIAGATVIPPTPSEAQPDVSKGIAQAGDALRKAESWDALTPAPAAAEASPPTDPAAPATETTAPAQPFDGWTVDADQKLHRPDGTFAEASEIDAYNAAIEQENAATAPTPEAAKPDEQKPEPIVVTLKARDGSDVEIEVTDEKVAETLRANQKDGLRGEEYRKKLQIVEEHLAEKRAFERMMETNPEAVILKHLPEEKQESLAVALVAKFWDQIAPKLVEFDTTPGARVAEIANVGKRTAEQEREYSQLTAREKYGVQLEHATRALIPEHVDEATAEQFMADAALDLGRAVQAKGAAIDVTEVKSVLARRLALYGFDKPAPAAASAAVPEPPKRPIARAVAKPTPAPTAPAVTTQNGAAVRQKVTAQKVAAAVPPAGAGAAPVRVPLAPPGATIEQASQALKKAKSWSEVGAGA